MGEPVAIVMALFFAFTPKKIITKKKKLDCNYRKKVPSNVGFNMNELLPGSRNTLSLAMGMEIGQHLCDL